MQTIFSRNQFQKTIDAADLDTIIAWPMDRISVMFACADQVRRHFLKRLSSRAH